MKGALQVAEMSATNMEPEHFQLGELMKSAWTSIDPGLVLMEMESVR